MSELASEPADTAPRGHGEAVNGPLDGIVVVALEQAVAAPLATRQLADLGATVLKIERPDGDFARRYDETVHGLSSHFVWLNRNKKSVVLDLKSDQGRTGLDALLAKADVFVQNLAPGAVDRLGYGAEQLCARYPRLVVCGVSGYGTGGPYGDKRAYDLLVQAEAGVLSVTGTADEPAKAGIPVADIAAGMYAYSGILAALYERERTGSGRALAVSLLDGLTEWMGFPYYYARYGGTAPARSGARHPAIAPYGPFRCADGALLIGIQNEREWQRFCAGVLDSASLATDPRFAGVSARVANRTELEEIIDAALADRPVAEVAAALDGSGVAYGSMNAAGDLAEHPQLRERGRVVPLDTENGTVESFAPVVESPGWPVRSDPVPALGADTDAVLRWATENM